VFSGDLSGRSPEAATSHRTGRAPLFGAFGLNDNDMRPP